MYSHHVEQLPTANSDPVLYVGTHRFKVQTVCGTSPVLIWPEVHGQAIAGQERKEEKKKGLRRYDKYSWMLKYIRQGETPPLSCLCRVTLQQGVCGFNTAAELLFFLFPSSASSTCLTHI